MDTIDLPGGSRLTRGEKAVIVKLNESARVLSTSFLNGGYREDLKFLFNYYELYNCPDGNCVMRASTNEGHLRIIAAELGLDPDKTAGLSTSARVQESTVKTGQYDDFSVTAVVTAGIDASGSRAGDPAAWHEKEGVPVPAKPGTINIMLFIDADLAPGAMARALTLCTEAKTAALQELLAPGCSSSGLATGSGTDGTIIVANGNAPVSLTNAGHHSKLGEHIGRVVKGAVKEGLVVEEGFAACCRGSVIKRIGRFGINEERLWQSFRDLSGTGHADREQFDRTLARINKDEKLIARATLYAHLLDLLHWNLIKPDMAVKMARDLLAGTGNPEEMPVPQGKTVWANEQETAGYLIYCFIRYLVCQILHPSGTFWAMDK